MRRSSQSPKLGKISVSINHPSSSSSSSSSSFGHSAKNKHRVCSQGTIDKRLYGVDEFKLESGKGTLKGVKNHLTDVYGCYDNVSTFKEVRHTVGASNTATYKPNNCAVSYSTHSLPPLHSNSPYHSKTQSTHVPQKTFSFSASSKEFSFYQPSSTNYTNNPHDTYTEVSTKLQQSLLSTSTRSRSSLPEATPYLPFSTPHRPVVALDYHPSYFSFHFPARSRSYSSSQKIFDIDKGSHVLVKKDLPNSPYFYHTPHTHQTFLPQKIRRPSLFTSHISPYQTDFYTTHNQGSSLTSDNFRSHSHCRTTPNYPSNYQPFQNSPLFDHPSSSFISEVLQKRYANQRKPTKTTTLHQHHNLTLSTTLQHNQPQHVSTHSIALRQPLRLQSSPSTDLSHRHIHTVKNVTQKTEDSSSMPFQHKKVYFKQHSSPNTLSYNTPQTPLASNLYHVQPRRYSEVYIHKDRDIHKETYNYPFDSSRRNKLTSLCVANNSWLNYSTSNHTDNQTYNNTHNYANNNAEYKDAHFFDGGKEVITPPTRVTAPQVVFNVE